MAVPVNYERNVFINCPFDEDYAKIFDAILFTVYRCGFVLRCAKEFQDSSTVRIKNIYDLIRESKYAIHDLSRVTLDTAGKLPRFNMPLELGIFIGCKEFGIKKDRSKEYLIIESEQFRFKQFISDLSGQDIKAHNGEVEQAIKIIRNWLATKTNASIPSPGIIISSYKQFWAELPDICTKEDWIPEELTFAEFTSVAVAWLSVTVSTVDGAT